MNRKLNCILLVDDNVADNDYHEMVIDDANIVECVRVAKDGTEALDYLNNRGKFFNKEDCPKPDLIFLDINMPKMNGFEFLDSYSHFDDESKAEMVVIMLSTSLNPDDKEKAESYQDVKQYINKPLDEDSLHHILTDLVKSQ